jgi:hypothetical protein
MGERLGVLNWVQERIPIEYFLLAILIYLSIEPADIDYPHNHGGAQAHAQMPPPLQCDARATLVWPPALCPALAAVTTSRKLELAEAVILTWEEAKELLQYLPFVLFRFPDHKGAGLLAILASHITNGPKAPTPKDSLALPNYDSNNKSSATTATSATLAVRNRFARSFSQLVASQLVPGDLITMAKSQGILTNMGVDYVVVFRFATTGLCIIYRSSTPLTACDLTDTCSQQQTRRRLQTASSSSPKLSHP